MVLVISLFAITAIPKTSSSGYTVTSSIVVNTVTYQIIDLISPTPSYVTVNEAAFTLLGGPLPSNVSLVLSSSYNGGTPSTVLGCDVNPHGSSVANCSFHIPFNGWGDYLLIGSIYGSNGSLLAQTGIDPLIEPEWR
jgi:hypothetical protein